MGYYLCVLSLSLLFLVIYLWIWASVKRKNPPQDKNPEKSDNEPLLFPELDLEEEERHDEEKEIRGRTIDASSLFSKKEKEADWKVKYNNYLKKPQWKKRRDEILERDGYRCQWCGSAENLQVHHKCYFKNSRGEMIPPWEYEDKYLITLCGDCHKWWHETHKMKSYYKKSKRIRKIDFGE